jgi:hypothetical protein
MSRWDDSRVSTAFLVQLIRYDDLRTTLENPMSDRPREISRKPQLTADAVVAEYIHSISERHGESEHTDDPAPEDSLREARGSG